MYDQELAVAKTIAIESGEIMKKYFNGEQQRIIKSDGTPVTIADTTINRLVIERLKAEFPSDIVIGEEESTGEYGHGRRWFCDPIDGTKAYTWGVPTAMFSLGLVVDGRPVVGVCYEPMLNKLYSGETGQGAFLNEQQLQVNQQSMSDGILAIGSAPNDIRDNKTIHRILDAGITTAVFSGAVYKAAAVADGRFVGYIEHKVNAHDMAAVEVIVSEAGGIVTGLGGEPNDYSRRFKGTIVSNGRTHPALVAIVGGET